MGCDIHMHVEYKRTINNIKKWICGDYFKVNPYYDDKCVYEKPFELVDFVTIGIMTFLRYLQMFGIMAERIICLIRVVCRMT